MDYTLYRYKASYKPLPLFFFHLDCIHVKCIYNRVGEQSLEVQNPKEYLRYKYKDILNNNLYHASSMLESTVDMCTYFLIEWYIQHIVYKPGSQQIEYTSISS